MDSRAGSYKPDVAEKKYQVSTILRQPPRPNRRSFCAAVAAYRRMGCCSSSGDRKQGPKKKKGGPSTSRQTKDLKKTLLVARKNEQSSSCDDDVDPFTKQHHRRHAEDQVSQESVLIGSDGYDTDTSSVIYASDGESGLLGVADYTEETFELSFGEGPLGMIFRADKNCGYFKVSSVVEQGTAETLGVQIDDTIHRVGENRISMVSHTKKTVGMILRNSARPVCICFQRRKYEDGKKPQQQRTHFRSNTDHSFFLEQKDTLSEKARKQRLRQRRHKQRVQRQRQQMTTADRIELEIAHKREDSVCSEYSEQSNFEAPLNMETPLLLLVSSPEVIIEDGKGSYTFAVTSEVMEKVDALGKSNMVSIGFDSNALMETFEQDRSIWDALFKPNGPVATYKQASTAAAAAASAKGAKGEGKDAEDAKRFRAFETMREGITSTQWWARYTSQVTSMVRFKCGEGHAVTMACVDAGPLSEVQKAEMPRLLTQISADLKDNKIAEEDGRVIGLRVFPTYDHFEKEINSVSAAGFLDEMYKKGEATVSQYRNHKTDDLGSFVNGGS